MKELIILAGFVIAILAANLAPAPSAKATGTDRVAGAQETRAVGGHVDRRLAERDSG